MSSTRRQASLSKIGEFNLIRSITGPSPPPASRVLLGIGDDAAIVRVPPRHHLVISTDLLIENVHFTRSNATFYEIGFKAAAANLSDMAAMGAQPFSLLVAVALPSVLKMHDWLELYRGLSRPCRDHGVHIVGGDTSSSPNESFVALTIVGTVKHGCELRRNGARQGDWIFVSGTLGDSSAGLQYLKKRSFRNPSSRAPLSRSHRYLVDRHFRPTPRISLGKILGARRWASAAIDVSDGLSNDLGHLCRQSKVGAIISASAVPLSPALKDFAIRQKADPLKWAFHGGEDYELLFTVPPKHAKKVEQAAKRLHVAVTKIGMVTSRRSGVRIEYSDRNIQPFPQAGYTHFHT